MWQGLAFPVFTGPSSL